MHIVNAAAGRIQVVAAAGIHEDNADVIIVGSGIHGVHAGSSVMSCVEISEHEIDQVGRVYDSTVTIGTGGANDMSWDAVDINKATRFVQVANEGFLTYKRNQRMLPVPTRTIASDSGNAEIYPTYF